MPRLPNRRCPPSEARTLCGARKPGLNTVTFGARAGTGEGPPTQSPGIAAGSVR